MPKRECTICKIQQDWTGKPDFVRLSGELYCEECAKPLLEEIETQIVCSECGKELDRQSARLFQAEWFLTGYSSMGKEWIEVSWDKKGVRQVNGQKPEEMILCSPCAEQFRKKRVAAEWRDMKVATVLVVLTVLGMMVAVCIFVFHIIK